MLLRRFPPNFLQTVLRRRPPNFLQTVLRRFPPNFLLLLVGRLASLFIVISISKKSHIIQLTLGLPVFSPQDCGWYSLVLRVHNSIFVAPPFFWKAILESSCVWAWLWSVWPPSSLHLVPLPGTMNRPRANQQRFSSPLVRQHYSICLWAER